LSATAPTGTSSPSIAGYLGGAQVEAIIYLLVGLSAVWMLVGHKKDCRSCSM